MILTDREIKLSLEWGLIDINPLPSNEAYGPNSVDLTLDPIINEFFEPQKGMEQIIDPSMEEIDYKRIIEALTRTVTIDSNDGYLLKPGTLLLAWTREVVNLKIRARLAGRVEGKSSLARLGLTIHMTAPIIHAGFNGKIVLEVFNHGRLKIRLRPHMRFCQFVLEQTLGTPDRGYQGQFAGQRAND